MATFQALNARMWPIVTILEFLSAGSESQLCHVLPMWPWASHFPSVDLSFFICKVGKTTLPPGVVLGADGESLKLFALFLTSMGEFVQCI